MVDPAPRPRLLLLSSLPVATSGTGLRMRTLARAMAAEGWEVWLTGDEPGREHEPYHSLALPSRRSRWRATLALLRQNVAAARQVRAGWVLCSKPLPVSCLPRLLAHDPQGRWILDVDDLEHAYWNFFPLSRGLQAFLAWILPQFDLVTTHCRELQEYLGQDLHVPSTRVARCPQAIDPFPLPDRETARAFIASRHPAAAGHELLLYAAHLGVAASGGEFLLAGFPRLHRQRPSVRLLIVGGGPSFARFQKLASDLPGVVLCGPVPHGEIPGYLAAADAAVNYQEDSPANRCRASLKLREYLAAGLPVATNLVGSDAFQWRDDVFAFATGNPDDFIRQAAAALERGRIPATALDPARDPRMSPDAMAAGLLAGINRRGYPPPFPAPPPTAAPPTPAGPRGCGKTGRTS